MCTIYKAIKLQFLNILIGNIGLIKMAEILKCLLQKSENKSSIPNTNVKVGHDPHL